MTDYLKQIAYNEGWSDYNHLSASDNPYDGVSTELANMWNEGWWDAFEEN
jgi:hypothetical protein